MENSTLKRAKFPLLWIVALLAYLGYAALASGEIPANRSNLSLLSLQEIATISVLMAVFGTLSITLKGPTNRLTNLVAGSIFGLGAFITFVDAVTVNLYGFYNLSLGLVVVALALIILLAYRMPKTRS